jgi:cytochrome P450
MSAGSKAIRVSDLASAAARDLTEPSQLFDLSGLSKTDLKARIIARVLGNPYWIFGILRVVRPVCRLPGTDWFVVTRFDHVKEVLAQNHVLEVPWSAKMKRLNNGGATFLLGIDQHDEHRRFERQLAGAFRREDVPVVADMAQRLAHEIIAQAPAGPSGTRVTLDAIEGLLTLVPTRICREYYGIPLTEHQEKNFARWSLAVSTYLFADPTGDPAVERVAADAGRRLRAVLVDALAAAKRAASQPSADRDTVLTRLVRMQAADRGLTDDVIIAHLLGMVSGFVPTNTIASGHMLDVLLGPGKYLRWHRRTFRRRMLDAVRDGDNQLLKRCLFETLRFKPINPGPFRTCREDYTLENGGFLGRRPATIPAGCHVVASTQSAMFDRRRVNSSYRFDPNRSRGDYMLFGSGMHACFGAALAEAQIPQTVKVLLQQKNLRRANGAPGKLVREGPFPAHLMVEFDR